MGFRRMVSNTDGDSLPRLGLLAATFGDGSIRVFDIPHIHILRNKFGHDSSSPIFVKPKRVYFTAIIPEALGVSISWGGGGWLALGCSNGNISVWDIKAARTDLTDNDPLITFEGHDSSVRRIVWDANDAAEGIHKDHPTKIISCGNDGRLQVRDVRDPWFCGTLYRIRAFMSGVSWVPEHSSLIFADEDGVVRVYTMSDEEPKVLTQKNKTEDDENGGLFCLLRTVIVGSHRACIWSLETSKFMPFLLAGGADGCVKFSNYLRSQRRSVRPVQYVLYRLNYDPSTDTYIFMEELPCELPQAPSRAENVALEYYLPEVAIQKVAWNPNESCASWVASGGTSGLVRIETTFGF
ncbi:WD40-repeat-containing domain protein [Phlyctochytrium arcticum]|nr:WD40-repeat-containing domain protein [Phlyctochytrium arcticum]